MPDTTKTHAVFLGFCEDALGKIRGNQSYEALHLRNELEVLVKKLEGWAEMKERPSDKEATIAAILDAYHRALELKAAG